MLLTHRIHSRKPVFKHKIKFLSNIVRANVGRVGVVGIVKIGLFLLKVIKRKRRSHINVFIDGLLIGDIHIMEVAFSGY